MIVYWYYRQRVSVSHYRKQVILSHNDDNINDMRNIQVDLVFYEDAANMEVNIYFATRAKLRSFFPAIS